MKRADLQSLPRFSDGWTFLYVEHARVEQEQHAIMIFDEKGRVPVPVASLSVLMLGPGTTLTHAAVSALADNGCSVVWCGEAGVRLYASGHGETNRAANLMDQARAWADPAEHLNVVVRLYRMRFPEPLDPALTLEQIRGREGVRVRETYARMARETGIQWSGRAYQRDDWSSADPVNRALSTANACLYGLCHAAIVATGFSPGLGFVHTGKLLAFVYDVADLYKAEVTIPLAFRAAQESTASGFEGRVRRGCREAFRAARLIERIVPDIQRCLGIRPEQARLLEHPIDGEAIAALWDGDSTVAGGRNFADTVDTSDDGGPESA